MNKKMQKAVLIAVALAVLLGLGGYFVVLPRIAQENEERIAAIIASLSSELQAESIKVDLLGGTATITGLKGSATYIDGSDMNVDIKEIVARGINYTAGSGTGAVKLADGLSFAGVKLHMVTSAEGLGQAIEQDISIESIALKDIQGDIASLTALLRDKAPRSAVTEVLPSFTIGSIESKKHVSSIGTMLGPVTMSVDGFSSGSTSVVRTENAVWENFTMQAFGSDVFSADSLGIAEMTAPNYLSLLSSAEELDDPAAFGPMFLANLKEAPIVIKGLFMDHVSCKLLDPQPLTLLRVDFDLSLGADVLSLKKVVKDLRIPVGIYRAASPEAMQFAAFYDKPLELSAELDFAITREDGKGVMRLKKAWIEDPALGAASASLDMFFEGQGDSLLAMLDAGPGDVYLEKGEGALEDRGLLENYFAGEFKALQEHNLTGESIKGPDDLRGMIVALVREEAAGAANPDQKALLEGLVQLLAAPGTLSMSVAPEQPVKVDGARGLEGPVNIAVEYRSAQ